MRKTYQLPLKVKVIEVNRKGEQTIATLPQKRKIKHDLNYQKLFIIGYVIMLTLLSLLLELA